MNWNIYLVRDKLIVPTFAKTSAGFYVEVEPVFVSSISDFGDSVNAIKQALELGNPRIPTPDREKVSRPVILQHAHAKSWSSFIQKATCWSVEGANGSYIMVPLQMVRLEVRAALTKNPECGVVFPDPGNSTMAAHKILNTILNSSITPKRINTAT